MSVLLSDDEWQRVYTAIKNSCEYVYNGEDGSENMPVHLVSRGEEEALKVLEAAKARSQVAGVESLKAGVAGVAQPGPSLNRRLGSS